MMKKLIIFMSLSLAGLSAMAAGQRVSLPEEDLILEVLGMIRTSPTGDFKGNNKFKPVPFAGASAEMVPPSPGFASKARVKKAKVGVGRAGKFAFKNSPKMPPIERIVLASYDADTEEPCTDIKKDELRRILKDANFKPLIQRTKTFMCSHPDCNETRQGVRNIRSHLLSAHHSVVWKSFKSGKFTITSDVVFEK